MPNETCRTAHYSGSKQVREQQKLAAFLLLVRLLKDAPVIRQPMKSFDWRTVCVGLINIVSVYKVTLYSAFFKAECWKCIQ